MRIKFRGFFNFLFLIAFATFKQLVRRIYKEALRFFQEHQILPDQMLCANAHQMKILKSCLKVVDMMSGDKN